jgi:hypothetical protein
VFPSADLLGQRIQQHLGLGGQIQLIAGFHSWAAWLGALLRQGEGRVQIPSIDVVITVGERCSNRTLVSIAETTNKSTTCVL